MNGTGGSGGEITSVDGGVTALDGGSEAHSGSGDTGGCGCALSGDASHDTEGAASFLVGLALLVARRRRSYPDSWYG